MDTARLLVGSIREAVPLTDVDQRGFIVLRDEAKVRAAIPEPLTEQAVDWWTNKELNKLQKRCKDSEEDEGKVKECTITVNHIKELVLEGLCEDQISIQIHLGIAVPLVLLSIDRLNANKGYVPGNIRLTLIGWNLKRGNEPHDRAALPWRQAIGINKPAGVKMPATSWRTTRHA